MPLGMEKKVQSLAAVFCLVCGKKLHWVTGNMSPFSAPFFPVSMWSSVSYFKTSCFIAVTVSLWRGSVLWSCLVWIWYCYSGFCGSAGRGAAVASGYWFTVQDNAFCWLCITLNAPTCTFPKLLSSKQDLHINYIWGGTYWAHPTHHIFFYQYNEDKHCLKMCILQKCTDYICFCSLYIYSKLKFCFVLFVTFLNRVLTLAGPGNHGLLGWKTILT